MSGNTILDLLDAHKRMHVMSTACRLGVFTGLAEGALAVDQIASVCNAVPRLLKALLDACVSIGLLQYDGERYTNAPVADVHLVEGRPQYLGNLVTLVSAESGAWSGLYDLVAHGVEHLAKILEPFGLRPPVERTGSPPIIHIAQSHNLLPGHAIEVPPTLPATADGGDADFVVGGVPTFGGTEHMAGHQLKTESGQGGVGENDEEQDKARKRAHR